MVMDNLGLALAVTATHLCRNSEAARRALPLAALPFLAAGDLYSIYRRAPRPAHVRLAAPTAACRARAGRRPS